MLQQDMTDSQRIMFQSEVSKVWKNRNTALVLTLFLGGLGAHRYYLGQILLGILYTLFCWTFVPAVIAFVELFFIRGRVDKYNERNSNEIAMKLKSFSS